MEPYERNISLRTIYITLLRRIEVILLIFIPVALISFIVTNFGMQKQYTSSMVIRRTDNANLTPAQCTTIKQQVTLERLGTVSENLAAGDYHIVITASAIQSGLGYGSIGTANVASYSITFRSSNSAFTKPVLDEIAKVTIEAMQTATGLTGDANKLVADPASGPSKTSKENTYFLIALAAGFVVACAIPFIYEIVADQVYDKKDIELWGVEAFELKASK